jgi:hypothetical protein
VQRLVALCVFALLAPSGLTHVPASAPRRMAKAVLADKIRGGWAGKMASRTRSGRTASTSA